MMDSLKVVVMIFRLDTYMVKKDKGTKFGVTELLCRRIHLLVTRRAGTEQLCCWCRCPRGLGHHQLGWKEYPAGALPCICSIEGE